MMLLPIRMEYKYRILYYFCIRFHPFRIKIRREQSRASIAVLLPTIWRARY